MNKQTLEKGISWTDFTWNPIVGCRKVSEACRNCWALVFARRMSKNSRTPYYHGLVDESGEWNGRSRFVESRLYDPINIKEPKMISVVLMGDLFLSTNESRDLDKIFTVMKMCQQHTFLILTKRPKSALQYFRRNHVRKVIGLPLPNVWIGVTVENQRAVQERVPALLDIEAKIRYISCEPLLGEINLDQYIKPFGPPKDSPSIDWIVAGGESGVGARPSSPLWFKSLRDQAEKAKIPFHFKQWGSWGLRCYEVRNISRDIVEIDGFKMRRTSKEKNGRLLDGKEWLQFPIDLR